MKKQEISPEKLGSLSGKELMEIPGVGAISVKSIVEVNHPTQIPEDAHDVSAGADELEAMVENAVLPDLTNVARDEETVGHDPSMSILNLSDYAKAEDWEAKALYVVALKPDTVAWLERFSAIANARVLKDPPSMGYAIEVCVRQIKQQQPLREADLTSMTQKV